MDLYTVLGLSSSADQAAIFHRVEWLMLLLALFTLFGFIPALAYASTRFDGWHNKRQAWKKRGK